MLALAVSVVTIGIFTGTVHAQSDQTPDNPRPQTPTNTNGDNEQVPTTELGEVRTQRQVERVLARCEAIKTRITAHIGRVNEATERQVGIYERLIGRIDLVIDRANEVQFDSTALVAARDNVAEKITLFSASATEVTDLLSAAADAACDEDATSYGTAISDARTGLQATRAASQDVRTTFRENVIPALQDFVAWLQVNQPSEEE